MKKLTILFVLILLISCVGQNTDNENLIASNPYLIGKWTGEARFMDRDFRKEIGKVKIEIEIKEDNTITGKIGDAKIINTSNAKRISGFTNSGKLDSKLLNDFSFNREKDHITLLFSKPQKNSENVTTSNVDIHLSRYNFDFYTQILVVDFVKEL